MDLFLAFGGGMVSFPLESSVLPFLMSEESRASSRGHFSRITTPLVDEVVAFEPSLSFSPSLSWQALPD